MKPVHQGRLKKSYDDKGRKREEATSAREREGKERRKDEARETESRSSRSDGSFMLTCVSISQKKYLTAKYTVRINLLCMIFTCYPFMRE